MTRRLDYDRLAADYAQHRSASPEVLRALVEAGPVTSATRVLEIGCGTGNYIGALATATGCGAWGVEPSAEMLARAVSRFPQVTFRRCPAEALDVPPASFDLAFSVDVIHHVSDRRAYIEQARTALCAGGSLCIVTDSESVIRARSPLSDYFPETVAADLSRYPRIQDLETLMSDLGLTDIHSTEVAFPYLLTDIAAYRARTYSVLHLISDEAYRRGLERLEQALQAGPIPACSRYTLLWARKPRLL